MKRERHGLTTSVVIQKAGMLLAGMIAVSAHAVITVSPDEMAQKNQWVQQNLLTAANLPPFSFTYGGQASSGLLPTWTRVQTDTALDTNRTQHVVTWTNSDLQVSCVAVEYNDYPMVQWTVYLKNIGSGTTPVLQSIQGLDTTISRATGPEFILNGNQGDSDTASSFQPYQTTLNPSTVTSFAPPSTSGKSCDGANAWPYYDLQIPGGGLILAVGWPGQWASSFTRDTTTNLQIKAGQQLTQLYLNPGEQIRTPLIALFFWQGTNVVRAQNLWRHWYMAHEIPRVNGQPPSTLSQVQGDSTATVNSYLQAGIQPDILWRDAGAGGTTWYPSSSGPYTGADQWLNTGTWDVDKSVYPNGLLGTSQAINALGVKLLLWFEPERVGNTINSFLATNNPAWLLPGTGTTVGAILNEGNPDAFSWLTNHIESLIISNGIGWYREDMNGGGPLPAWQNNDATNRKGITENLYVQGHLAYWDALLAMNPGLRIDSCASGGRRNDLESMQRAVPLTRSDYESGDMASVADGNQCQTYGLSSWLPFQGSGCFFSDTYSFRSFYLASFGMAYGLSQDNSAAEKQAYTECKRIGPIMLNGDYYPLTPYSQAKTVWMAWQFDRPDTGEGCAQIFRRTNSTTSAMTFQLQGLDPSQTYDVQDFDRGYLGLFTGSDLMSSGLTFQLNPRQSAVVYYARHVAVINPGDATLGLWLKADNLSGSTVPTWTDNSSYGTTFSVPLIGEAVNDPSNHTPQLVTFTNNGAVFNAVQFRQACDPVTPNTGCWPSGHLADRLWQTSNLGASDPSAIGPTNDISFIMVCRNDDPNTGLGPSQFIMGKRGPGECPYQFGLDASALKSDYVVYAGSTQYDSTNAYPASPEWGITEVNVTSGGQLTFREYFASKGGWRTSTMAAARGSSGASPVSAAYWAAASTPFSIGFHCQSIGASAAAPFGNGEAERFAGEIAEVALYKRSLAGSERTNVENYLLDKYFSPRVSLISAHRSFVNTSAVQLQFSKALLGSSVTTLTNYSINNGISVTSATLDTDPTIVDLTVSPAINSACTVTVNGVQDTYGVAIAANSTASISYSSYLPGTNDAALVLWLKADTLSGSTVPAWTDSSSNGTTFAVPLFGEAANDASNHTPRLVTFNNNGAVFKAVQFRQAYDPVTPDPVAGHLADRLWQTNKLGASDPTAIGPANDITLIMIYRNDAPNLVIGPAQTIVAKRGPSQCPYEFGFDASAMKSDFMVYSGSTQQYDSTNTYPGSAEWGIMELNITTAGRLTFREYFASQGGWRTSTKTAARGSSGASPVSTTYWSAASTPFSIGFHCQSTGASSAGPFGNGEYERFAGAIGQVLLYNRSLSSNELANVEEGLLDQYFNHDLTTTTLASSANPSTYGGSVTFTATVSPAPTGGTVQFFDNGSPLSSPVAVNTATGQAALAYSALGAGSHPITATFSGTTNSNGIIYPGSTTASATAQTVNPVLLSVSAPTIAPKTYDGTTTAGPVTVGTLSGFVGSETVTATATATSPSANVGTYTDTVIYTLANGTGGGLAANYSLANGTATGTITAVPVTLSGSRPYDATATAAAAILSVANKASGDTVNVASGSGTLAGANAGTQGITSLDSLALGNNPAGNYTLTGASGSVTITPLPLTLSGSRTYDGTATIAAANLTIANQISGDALTLSGTASLASANAGSAAIINNISPVTRVQSASGSVGSSKATFITVTLPGTPANGNTLIAVIATRNSSQNTVSSISGGGATWSRAVQNTPSTTTTTEIWYAANVSGGGTTITITLASSQYAAAVVGEYSGVLTASPLDVTANNANSSSSSSATTGTTAGTAQASELWVGGIGLSSSSYTLSGILNSFSSVASAQSSYAVSSSNAKVYFLDRVATATGTASSGATVSSSSRWSGAIATFKAQLGSINSLTPARRQSATGAVGSNAATSFTAPLSSTPEDGNTLIAVISTRSSSASAVSGISGGGATWTRAAQNTPSTTTTTEIWYAPNVSGGGTTITINLASSLYAAAVVGEYSGVLTASPLDVTANNANSTSSTAATTGTTPQTTQASELWVGGIGLSNSSYTLSSILNSFSSVANAQSGSSTSGNNAMVYFLEYIATAPATASSGGTVSTSSRWSGAIATFKTQPGLVLGGAAAPNYTLSGASGSVTISPKPLAVTAPTIASRTYDGTTSAGALTVGTLSGFVGSETVTATATAAAYSSADVGSYSSTVAYTLSDGTSGGLAANYSLANDTATGQITPKALTAQGTLAANDKCYDGTTTAMLTGSAALKAAEPAGSGNAADGTPYAGDPVSLAGAATGAFASPGVGTGISVNVSGLSLNNNSAGDYTLTQPTFSANITPPPALTTDTTNQTACAGSEVIWSVVATGTSLTYQWQRDGTNLVEGVDNFTGTTGTTLTNSAVSVADALSLTNGYACVVSLGTCTTASTTASLTVNPTPTVNVNSPTVCASDLPATITATTASGAEPYTYTWSVPSGASDPGNVASFGATVAGTYSVVVSDTNNCSSASGSGDLIINPAPVAGTATPADDEVASGASTTITLTDQIGSIVNWQSSTDGGASWGDIASTDNPLASGPLTATTQFRAVVGSGVCSTEPSSVATVAVRAPVAPTLSGVQRLNATAIQLTFSGPQGQTYKVWQSTNAKQPVSGWNVLTTGTFGSEAATYTDNNATDSARFYRISSP